MRAYVTPFRVLKVRLESDPTEEHRFEIGRLVPCETCGHPCNVHIGGARRCLEAGCGCVTYEGRREYDAADLANAVGAMVELLTSNRVTVAEVERPHTYTDGAEIARAVVLAIADAGIDIDAPWRKDSGVAAHSDNRPQGANDGASAPGPSTRGHTSPAPRDHDGDAPVVVPSPTVLAWPPPDGTLGPAVTLGGNVAGIDPGTARIAIVVASPPWARSVVAPGSVLSPERGHCAHVAHRVFDIGHVEARGKGRGRHVFTDDDMRAVCPSIAAFLRAHGVERAVVESSNGGMFNNASSAIQANHVGGAILGYLLANGIAASRVSESTWYCAIVKGRRKKRFRADPALTAALQKGYAGTWPEVTGEDVKDAGGIVLGSLAPKKAKKKPAKVTGTGKPHEKRTNARAAKRAASGCTCKGRRSHALSCPRHEMHSAP